MLGTTRTGRTVVRATRGELADLADGYAAALHRRGLRRGDTVAFAVRPGPRALAVMLAAHRLGLRIAVLDPAAGPDVLLARLALAEPRLVLADAAAQAVAGLGPPAGPPRPPRPARPGGARPGRHGRPRLPGCAPALAPASPRARRPDYRARTATR